MVLRCLAANQRETGRMRAAWQGLTCYLTFLPAPLSSPCIPHPQPSPRNHVHSTQVQTLSFNTQTICLFRASIGQNELITMNFHVKAPRWLVVICCGLLALPVDIYNFFPLLLLPLFFLPAKRQETTKHLPTAVAGLDNGRIPTPAHQTSSPPKPPTHPFLPLRFRLLWLLMSTWCLDCCQLHLECP